jgi:hypothetical protein
VHPLNAPSIFIEPDGQQEHSHLSNKNIGDGRDAGQDTIAQLRWLSCAYQVLLVERSGKPEHNFSERCTGGANSDHGSM